MELPDSSFTKAKPSGWRGIAGMLGNSISLRISMIDIFLLFDSVSFARARTYKPTTSCAPDLSRAKRTKPYGLDKLATFHSQIVVGLNALQRAPVMRYKTEQKIKF